MATRARGANFDPNDPMTWNAPAAGEGDDEAFFQEMGAPVEDLMQLSDEQLGQLLGQEGVQVPIMIDDDDNASADAPAAAVSDIDLPPATAGEAINKGLALYKSGDYPTALAAFTNALDLPGTGPIRSRKARVAPAGPRRASPTRPCPSTSRSPFTTTARAATRGWTIPRPDSCPRPRAGVRLRRLQEHPVRSRRRVPQGGCQVRGDHGEVRAAGRVRGSLLHAFEGDDGGAAEEGWRTEGRRRAELIEGLFQAFKDRK